VIDTNKKTRPRVEVARSHLVRLSTAHNLARIIRAAWKVKTNVQRDVFYRVFRRWLLLFTAPTLDDVVAVRAQYPSEFAPLFEEYFMQRHKRDLIDSARITGQHISRQAWFAASDASDGGMEARRKKTQSILAGLESLLRDCNSGPEMLARLSVQAGRLTGSSFPPEARRFFDAVAADDPDSLSLKDARNLLLAYMRLRTPSTAPADAGEDEENAADDKHPADDKHAADGEAPASANAAPEDPLASVEQL